MRRETCEKHGVKIRFGWEAKEGEMRTMLLNEVNWVRLGAEAGGLGCYGPGEQQGV